MVDWWELMQAQPSFLFNGEDLTHNNQQSFKKPLTSTPLSNIHQKVFCHKVLTYKGAMLQYWFCFVWSCALGDGKFFSSPLSLGYDA